MSGSQDSPGCQENAQMLNRSAVVVSYRQAFRDWLRSVEELECSMAGSNSAHTCRTTKRSPARSRRLTPAGAHSGITPVSTARSRHVRPRHPAKKPAALRPEACSPSRRFLWVERRQLYEKPRQIKDADGKPDTFVPVIRFTPVGSMSSSVIESPWPSSFPTRETTS